MPHPDHHNTWGNAWVEAAYVPETLDPNAPATINLQIIGYPPGSDGRETDVYTSESHPIEDTDLIVGRLIMLYEKARQIDGGWA